MISQNNAHIFRNLILIFSNFPIILGCMKKFHSVQSSLGNCELIKKEHSNDICSIYFTFYLFFTQCYIYTYTFAYGNLAKYQHISLSIIRRSTLTWRTIYACIKIYRFSLFSKKISHVTDLFCHPMGEFLCIVHTTHVYMYLLYNASYELWEKIKFSQNYRKSIHN